MNKIEVEIMNPEVIRDAERMMVCAARLTQRGEKIKSVQDFIELYNKPYSDDTVRAMCQLPHPTIQKFAAINVVVVGASRRFLAQITRHQNEVKFMSASLQYSDYSGQADFVIPYNVMVKGEPAKSEYLASCRASMAAYEKLSTDIPTDECGYLAPQALRNVLIISATPYQWKHMIRQRTCRRNTLETRYVMLRIWQQLYDYAPILLHPAYCGPACMPTGACPEGKMSCGNMVPGWCGPGDILMTDFPYPDGGLV